jgi:hypothetical protein
MQRLNEFCHTLLADAIRWTQGPFDELQEQALVQIIGMLAKPAVDTNDFLKIRRLLLNNNFHVSPPIRDDEEE